MTHSHSVIKLHKNWWHFNYKWAWWGKRSTGLSGPSKHLGPDMWTMVRVYLIEQFLKIRSAAS